MSQQTTKPTALQYGRRRSPSRLPASRNGALPPSSAEALVRQQVILYVSGSDESRSAFELLEGAGVDFRAIASRRPVPLATFGRLRFVGLGEARELVTLLHDLDAAWRAEAEQVMPDLVNASEPHLMTEMETERARWRQQARAVLARVSAARRCRARGLARRNERAPRRRLEQQIAVLDLAAF